MHLIVGCSWFKISNRLLHNAQFLHLLHDCRTVLHKFNCFVINLLGSHVHLFQFSQSIHFLLIILILLLPLSYLTLKLTHIDFDFHINTNLMNHIELKVICANTTMSWINSHSASMEGFSTLHSFHTTLRFPIEIKGMFTLQTEKRRTIKTTRFTVFHSRWSISIDCS